MHQLCQSVNNASHACPSLHNPIFYSPRDKSKTVPKILPIGKPGLRKPIQVKSGLNKKAECQWDPYESKCPALEQTLQCQNFIKIHHDISVIK
jgi:hypothetical protein